MLCLSVDSTSGHLVEFIGQVKIMLFVFVGTEGIYVGPQIGMNPKPILGLPDLEY
jgi:hypothetical protein